MKPERPYVLDGEYPTGETEFGLDPFMEEGDKRARLARDEAGPLHGQWPGYPDRGLPRSPQAYEAELRQQEELRAMHGGLPDSPEDMPARATDGGGKPFSRMKGR